MEILRAMDVNASGWSSEHEYSAGDASGGKFGKSQKIFAQNCRGLFALSRTGFAHFAADFLNDFPGDYLGSFLGNFSSDLLRGFSLILWAFFVNSLPPFGSPALDNRMGVVSQLVILPKGQPFGNPPESRARRCASRSPKGGKP